MNKFKKCITNKTMYGLSVLFIGMSLSSCIQSKASSDTDIATLSKPKNVITDNTLKIVNATFYQTFVLGDWRYKGAQDLHGKINAYIQIPIPMDMSLEIQKSYLQKAICPSSVHSTMWKEIDGIPLNIHVYTHTQKNSLYVTCINPLKVS